MTRQQKWQYKCDFCGKKSLSAAHMARHERACTNNPERSCGVCVFVDILRGLKPFRLKHISNLQPMSALLAVLPAPPPVSPLSPEFEKWEVEFLAAINRLRELTNGCPACMLAAVRQRGLCVKGMEGYQLWQYEEEKAAFWDRYNEAAATGEGL